MCQHDINVRVEAELAPYDTKTADVKPKLSGKRAPRL